MCLKIRVFVFFDARKTLKNENISKCKHCVCICKYKHKNAVIANFLLFKQISAFLMLYRYIKELKKKKVKNLVLFLNNKFFFVIANLFLLLRNSEFSRFLGFFKFICIFIFQGFIYCDSDLKFLTIIL